MNEPEPYSRAQLDQLIAQRMECPVAAVTAMLDQSFAAWKQALQEFGVPDHPGGQCPGQPCPCSAMAELVTFRAYELMGLAPEMVLQDAEEAERLTNLLDQYRKKED